MEQQEKILSGSTLAKNTVYNLLGLGSPIVIAVFLLPVLISGLGNERFGILNIGWVVIGYFSLFDFGIGRALTKIVSEKIAQKRSEDVSDLFWTSMLVMTGVSILGSIMVIIFTPLLVEVLDISPGLKQESHYVFYTLAAAIPIVTTTAGLRGVLESYQKFGLISIVRTALGAFTFLGPALILIFTNNLFWVIFIIVIFRVLIWGIFFYYCLDVSPGIKEHISFKKSSVKPVLALSGWITVSNLISPVITYVDRFLIGAILSVTAVTFYSTPFEVVTRFLIISGGIVGVLFPAFSASYLNDKVFARKLFIRGTKYIYIMIFPITVLFILFAGEILPIWLGNEFVRSTIVFQLLSFGILFNSLAQIPFTFIQGIGKPDLAAKLHLAELPVYLVMIWFAVQYFGINGAAAIWTLRVTADSILLFLFSFRIITLEKSNLVSYANIIIVTTLVCTIAFFLDLLLLKFIFMILVFASFLFLSWKYFLDTEERNFVLLKYSWLVNKLQEKKAA